MSIFNTHSGSIENLTASRVRTAPAGELPLAKRVEAEMETLAAAIANLNTTTQKPAERTAAGECSYSGGTSFIAGCSRDAAALIAAMFTQAPTPTKGQGRG